MTVLSDAQIRRAIRERRIIIEPEPADDQFATSAVDLYLGEELVELKEPDELSDGEPPGVVKGLVIDPQEVDVPAVLSTYGKRVRREPDGSFILHPRHLTIGITRERIALPRQSKIAARVEGRSTLARLGLIVHLTAPTIHAGFEGHIALEMYNLGYYPLKLRPGSLPICQLIFEEVSQIPRRELKTAYRGQKSVRKAK